jgi:hypothetical protein
MRSVLARLSPPSRRHGTERSDEIGHMDLFFTKHHDCFVIQRFVMRCCEKCKKCGHRPRPKIFCFRVTIPTRVRPTWTDGRTDHQKRRRCSVRFGSGRPVVSARRPRRDEARRGEASGRVCVCFALSRKRKRSRERLYDDDVGERERARAVRRRTTDDGAFSTNATIE